MDLKVGKQVKNENGKVYTILAVKGGRALIVGGWDYIVIDDLECFRQTGAWGNGKYFPFFEDRRSTQTLERALYYFTHGKYKPEEVDE